jgi:hypothetical protein
MLGIPNPYAIGGAAILAVAGIGGSYVKGRSDDRAVVNAKVAQAMDKARIPIVAQQGRIDRVEIVYAAIEANRQIETRTFHTESTRYVDRPAQRLACIDPDAVRLLDRATAAANVGADQPAAAPAHR